MAYRTLPLALLVLGAGLQAQIQVSIPPAKDNTLYEDVTGSLSNGAGTRMFCGLNGQGELRRALVAFDVAAAIPPCATIQSVDLEVDVVMSISGSLTCYLHRVERDWGEGGSVGRGQGEGQGGPAQPEDATWLHTFYPGQTWTKSGGDHAATPSASAAIGAYGRFMWSSTAAMVADVQGWLDDPGSNFGWLIRTDELPFLLYATKAFSTKDDPNPAAHPVLRVTYSVPQASAVSTGTGCAGSGAVPLALSASGAPVLPSPGFALNLSGGPAGPHVFLLGQGLLPAPLPLGGCWLYLDASAPVIAVPGNPSRVLPLPLPSNPALLCLQLPVQGLVLDTGAAALATSNALTLVFGGP